MATFLDGNVQIVGTLAVSGGITGATRGGIDSETSKVYELPFTDFRVWDAFTTNLPSSGATDDIGLATGTFGTSLPYLRSQDMNAAGAVVEYARCMFTLPPEFVAGSAVGVRLAAGMQGVVASVSATVDVEAYKSNRDTTKTGSDLCTTPATTCNSVTLGNKDFVLTAAGLSPGDVLDIRIAIIANSGTASSHFVVISHAEVLLTIQG